MNKRIFVGVDAQHDFIDGVLGSEEARATIGDLGKSAKFARACGFDVYWTTDIHEKDDYPLSQEGKNLPIYHGEPMAWGSQLHEDCGLAPGDKIISKSTFGSNFLAHDITNKDCRIKREGDLNGIQAIVLGGYCSDICGISNALLLKAALPEVPIYWLAYAGAGVTPDKNAAALEVMQSCQIHIINTYDEFQELCYDLDKEAGAE
jgi:nicotinamidase-related amidase